MTASEREKQRQIDISWERHQSWVAAQQRAAEADRVKAAEGAANAE